MTLELPTMPAPAPAPAALPNLNPRLEMIEAPVEGEVGNDPFINPARTALLASAYEKLAEASRRIDRLQARLKSLSIPPGTHLS